MGSEQRDVGGDVGEVDVDVTDAAAPALAPEHDRLDEIEELPEAAARTGWGKAQRQRPAIERYAAGLPSANLRWAPSSRASWEGGS